MARLRAILLATLSLTVAGGGCFLDFSTPAGNDNDAGLGPDASVGLDAAMGDARPAPDAAVDATPCTEGGPCPSVLFESIRPIFDISSAPYPWGYNQSKIVRRGDSVYMIYNVDASDCPGGYGKSTMFKKEGDGPWVMGASLPATAAGVLVDPDGYVIAHAYWDGTSTCTPNIAHGGISVWTSQSPGDIHSPFSQLWAQPPTSPGFTEATGRTGGAVDCYGNIIFAEGVGGNEWGWYKQASHSSYSKVAMASGLDGFYSYPIVQPLSTGYWAAFTVRYGDYYDSTFFVYPDGGSFTWGSHHIADQRGTVPPCSVQQSDTYEDSSGRVHVLYRYCDGGGTIHYDHLVSPSAVGPFDPVEFVYADADQSPLVQQLSYVRLTEVDGAMYHVGATTVEGTSQIFFRRVGSGSAAPPYHGWSRVAIPSEVAEGTEFSLVYPYVSAPRGGGHPTPPYVDVLAVNGTGADNGLAVYVRIPSALISSTP